jgi:steroid delta-isomerase-like uncharacterized protein
VRKHFDIFQKARGNNLTLICEMAICLTPFKPKSPLHPFIFLFRFVAMLKHFPGKRRSAKMADDQEPNVTLHSVAEAYTAAWCSQDPARVASFYAEDGALKVNDAAPAVGREAITEVAQSFMTAFPDIQVIFDGLRIEDDRPVYHWTLTGTNNGPGGTGRAVRISGYEVWQVSADGLIAKSLGHFDADDYRQQLGLVEPE